jgi:hypothetical protein
MARLNIEIRIEPGLIFLLSAQLKFIFFGLRGGADFKSGAETSANLVFLE